MFTPLTFYLINNKEMKIVPLGFHRIFYENEQSMGSIIIIYKKNLKNNYYSNLENNYYKSLFRVSRLR